MDIKQFSGLANKVAQEAIQLGALTTATNIDIDNAGKLRRRRGTTLIASGGFHSLYTTADLGGYVVRDGDLCRFSPSLAMEVIAPGVGDDPLSYVRVADRVYAKSRTKSLTFTSTGAAQPWGIPLVPVFSVDPIGSNQIGSVRVAVVYRRNSDGLEGGATYSVPCNIGPGVSVSGIPELEGHTASIYCTSVDGEVLMLACDGVTGSATVHGQLHSIPMRTFGKTPPTGTGPLAWLLGRILIADGNVLWATDPYQYELVDMVGGYKMFESDITFLASMTDGVFVGTQTGVFFMSGPFESAQLMRVSTQRAPAQTPQKIDMSDVLKGDVQGVGVLFMTDAGVCVGVSGGNVINLTNKDVEFPKCESVSVMVRSQDGISQFIGVASHPTSTPTGSARFGDFVDAEIVRFKGV